MNQAISRVTYALTTIVGLTAFLYPFWLPAITPDPSQQMAHAGDSALMLTVLLVICLAILMLEAQSQGLACVATRVASSNVTAPGPATGRHRYETACAEGRPSSTTAP